MEANTCVAESKPLTRGSTRVWIKKKGRHVCTTNFWAKKLPILGFLRNYNVSSLVSDFIAGITVGLTFIPTAMVASLVAGLPSKHGLYASLMCYFTYAILGSRREVNVGGNIVLSLFCKPFVDKFGPDIVFIYCFYTGCAVTLIGVLNLGFLLDFISAPVMEGFLSSASVAAGVGQIPSLLGFKSRGSNFLGFCANILQNIHNAKLWDTVLGFGCIATLILLSYGAQYGEMRSDAGKVKGKEVVTRSIVKYLSLARTAIVVIISTAIVANLDLDVNIAGEIERGLPDFKLPTFTTQFENRTLSAGETFRELSSGAPITLVIVIISSAAAKFFANGQSVDTTQEMTAVGISNIMASFVQGFPCTGSVIMSIVNKTAGVKSPLSNVFAGVLIILCLCFFTNILQYFPTTTLAAIVLCSIPKLIRIHKCSAVYWRAKKSELIPLHVTFWVCLFGGLDAGMICGIASNMLIILYDTARPDLHCKQMQVEGRSVLLVRPDRAVTFPAAEHVKACVTKYSFLAPPGLVIVLEGTHVYNIDTTAVQVLKSLISEVHIRNQQVYLWQWREKTVTTFMQCDKTSEQYFRYDESLEDLVNFCSIEVQNHEQDEAITTVNTSTL